MQVKASKFYVLVVLSSYKYRYYKFGEQDNSLFVLLRTLNIL